MRLLPMSIQAGVMIAVIIIIRALAINSLPKKTFLALWGIVLLRLLLPFSLPSPFSVYSLVNRTGLTVPATQAPIVNASPIAAPQQDTKLPAMPELPIWGLVWVIGVALCALYFILAYVRCHKEFRASQTVENDFVTSWITEHTLRRPIQIRQSSFISAPLTYGIFRPVILMPKQTDWTDVNNMQYVLTHEYIHIRRFDAVTKMLYIVALCVHWFNPLVWGMFILANRDIELSCDEVVVRSFGETIKSSYALALISMEERKNALMPFCNNFSKNAIEERIKSIMKTKKASLLTSLIAVVLVVGVTAGFATSAMASENSVGKTLGENVIDLASSSPFRITAGSGPSQSYDYSIDKGNQFLIVDGQKVQVNVDYLEAFHVKSSEEIIKLIFEDSEHHVVEVELGNEEKKDVIFENAGIYSLRVQNDGNNSIYYSFFLQ